MQYPPIHILVVLHDLTSLEYPWQGLPPAAGAGLSHFRSREIAPIPHVTLQSVQLPHSDQPPSTTLQTKKVLDDMIDRYCYLIFCFKEKLSNKCIYIGT